MYIISDTLHASHTPSPTVTFSEPRSSCRQSEFWFCDGNIVLVADSIHFKVHRGQLERQSETFRDILSIPQPADALMIDGCHILELHDSAEDVLHLLKALYDGLYFKKPYAQTFSSIAAVLRLSTKYFIDHLRERCLARLATDWPTTLAGWDLRESSATNAAGLYAPRDACVHPVLMINFAREMGLDSFLPAAFYDLCRYGPSKIVAGAPEGVQGSNSQPSAVRLSPEDLLVVLCGREAAQRAVAKFIEDQLTERAPAPDCQSRDRQNGRFCRESFYFIMLNTLRSVGGIACGRDGDPLFTLTQAVEMLSRSDFSDGTKLCCLNICAACKNDFTRSVGAIREQMWLQIPSWFGLRDFEV